MSAASGGSYTQPPEPDPTRPVHDTSEPVGYALGDPAGFEQPPPPLVRPADAYDLDPVLPSSYPWDRPSSGLSITGFVLGVAGLAFLLVEPLLTAPVASVGVAVSAIALARCRLRRASGHRWALAGLVLGIACIALVLTMLGYLKARMTTIPG